MDGIARLLESMYDAVAPGFLPFMVGAATVGWVPAIIALCGVVALFPAPVAALANHAIGRVRARLARQHPA